MTKLKTWRESPNCYHYTKDKLYCDFCKKQTNIIIQTQDNKYICNSCFNELNIFGSFDEREFIRIRMIEDVLFDKRRETRKKERGILTFKLRYEIFKRDNFRCVLCGATGKEVKLEVDHIIPISEGGKTIKSNLRTLCFKCNRGKGNLIEKILNKEAK
jgi:5-methylcytosine-specific restriction endonuclease McrA